MKAGAPNSRGRLARRDGPRDRRRRGLLGPSGRLRTEVESGCPKSRTNPTRAPSITRTVARAVENETGGRRGPEPRALPSARRTSCRCAKGRLGRIGPPSTGREDRAAGCRIGGDDTAPRKVVRGDRSSPSHGCRAAAVTGTSGPPSGGGGPIRRSCGPVEPEDRPGLHCAGSRSLRASTERRRAPVPTDRPGPSSGHDR